MKTSTKTPNDAVELLKLLADLYSNVVSVIRTPSLSPQTRDEFLNIERDVLRATGKVVADVTSKYPYLKSVASSFGFLAEDAQINK